MKVLCVDDEPIVLEDVQEVLEKQPDIEQVTALMSPEDAIDWLKSNHPDAAFLDIHMGSMDGLTLAKHLKEQYHDCAVVFITGYSEYAVNAFALHADGYLLKPVTEEDVRCELDHIKNRYALEIPGDRKRIYVQCFGNFEFFVDGEALRFERKKTKELLAYLVDRHGGSTTMGELVGILWEDSADTISVRSNLRNLIHDLKKTLASVNAEKVLIKSRDAIALDCSLFDCDFYDFQKGLPYAVNLYRGEYMQQYSWAELTNAGIR